MTQIIGVNFWMCIGNKKKKKRTRREKNRTLGPDLTDWVETGNQNVAVVSGPAALSQI